MPLSDRLRGFLDSHHAEYSLSAHPNAVTAREVAVAEHLPAREVAKSVVVFGDGEYYMIVLPANRLLDFREAHLALGLSQVRLATEDELSKLFPDCELGAMPPVGSLYGLPVYLDSSLAAEDAIAFNAGTHQDVIHMRTADYRKIVRPLVVPLAREAARAHGGW
jgi:Ala-tRNA(Pro) deacylase